MLHLLLFFGKQSLVLSQSVGVAVKGLAWNGSDRREQPIWIQEALGQPALCEGGNHWSKEGWVWIFRVQQITNAKDVQPPTCFFTTIHQCQKRPHALFSDLHAKYIWFFNILWPLGVFMDQIVTQPSTKKQPKIGLTVMQLEWKSMGVKTLRKI